MMQPNICCFFGFHDWEWADRWLNTLVHPSVEVTCRRTGCATISFKPLRQHPKMQNGERR